MWFLMLVLGALAGAGIGGGVGALAGAIGGAFLGWALTQKRISGSDSRLTEIEESVRALSARIDAIERRPSYEAPRTDSRTDVSASAVAEPPVAPEADAAPLHEPAPPPPFAELPPLRGKSAARIDAIPEPTAARLPPEASPEIFASPTREAAESPISTPSAPTRELVARPNRIVAQFVGIALGALLGVSFGGVGALVGALIGWVIVLAVQSQNERAARDREAFGVVPREAQEAAAAPPPPPSELAPLTAEAAAAQYAADSAEPAVELQPTLIQRLLGGNIVAKVGVLILFIGVGFLLKFAYDQGRLPVQVRLAAVALVACGMLYGGWRLLARRRLYGLILQGCGIGLLYLDVFFALKVYGFVDPITGFAAFMGLGVAATLLAVRQDAKVLAVLGLTGAFLAPILASTGAGNHVLLFSYYTLLNSFVLAISWFKAWRDLNLVGFVFTFVVGLLWGANNYRPELFFTVEPFVLMFFAMYLVIPILFALRQPPELKGLVDGTLVFGTPICVAFMQAELVRGIPYGLAWSAGLAAVVYAALAALTLKREHMRLLGETYIALAVVFATLAVFFAFDAYPTFALWTLEGAAIFWVGWRQGRVLARMFGLGLQLAGTAYFLHQYSEYDLSNPWWNAFVLGCIIIAVAGFIIAWLLHRYRDLRTEFDPSDSLVLVWATAWWSIAGVHALYHALPWAAFASGLLAFVAASCALFELGGAVVQWRALRRAATLLMGAMAFAFVLQVALVTHPFGRYGWVVWPASLALFCFIVRRHERDGIAIVLPAQHASAFCLSVALLTWETAWQLDAFGLGKPWLTAAFGLLPGLAVAGVTRFSGKIAWPFGVHYAAIYRDLALAGTCVYLAAWALYANFSVPGDMRPVPYVPLLNPLDVASIVAFAAVWQWSQTLQVADDERRRMVLGLFIGTAFVWINCVMLRTIHYWAGVDYDLGALARSVLVQSGFSLLWTTSALFLMMHATRAKRRHLWMIGAALLGVVVVKLFVNDLSNTGTVARIVSFIGVGAGLMLIGYVAPVPPGDVERQAD